MTYTTHGYHPRGGVQGLQRNSQRHMWAGLPFTFWQRARAGALVLPPTMMMMMQHTPSAVIDLRMERLRTINYDGVTEKFYEKLARIVFGGN